MRIAIYGLPCSGKTTLMNQVSGWKLISGGALLHELAPKEYGKEWADLEFSQKDHLRRVAADYLRTEDDYIIDGHYSFGKQPVLPDEETLTYDVSFYLYTDPAIIHERMLNSEKNRRFAGFDTAAWQATEIEKIREKCHRLGRDFYVISDAGKAFPEFLNEVVNGFSCMSKGRQIAAEILKKSHGKDIVISDGDKTLAIEDTERQFSSFRTTVFDGDFYTGYQTWLHTRENWNFEYDISKVQIRKDILEAVTSSNGAVITSGPVNVWQDLASYYDFQVFGGNDISADTKYFAVKALREAGKMVTAYGDSMSDYYMLHEADMGVLMLHHGNFSRSLKDRDLHGLYIQKDE